MAKTRLFRFVMGEPCLILIGRAQGWSDTPLTAEGERGDSGSRNRLCVELVWSLLELFQPRPCHSGHGDHSDELGLKDRFLLSL